MNKYRFYIGFVGDEVEVFPLNTNKLKFETKPEDGQIFYRKKMVGKIKFYKQDFDYLYAIEKSVDRCQTLTLRVEQLCSDTYKDYWLGTFSLNDAFWDIDNCTVELQANVKDKYSCILDNKKKAVNILELSTILKTEANLMPIGLQYSPVCVGVISTLAGKTLAPSGRGGPYGTVPDLPGGVPDSDSYVNTCIIESEGWQVYKVVYRDKIQGADTWTCETTFFREVLETFNSGGTPSMPIGDGWVAVDTGDINGSPTTIWARKPYGGIEDNYVVSYQMTHAPSDYNSNLRRIVTILELSFKTQTNFSYDNGRIFNEAVWYTANKFCGSIPGMISDFFTCNPDGTAPDNEEYEHAKSKLNLLTISQKFDVLTPTPIKAKEVPVTRSPRYYVPNQQVDNQTKTIQGATKGFLTWEQMEEILTKMFDCYWDIDDATGAIRVEHESYWASRGTFDLTDEKYKLNVRGKGRYQYEKEGMPQIEIFQFMEKSYDIDFIGDPIKYQTICVNQDPTSNQVTYQVSQVTTDLNLIFAIKEGISKDGFVLMQNYIDAEDSNKVKVGVEDGYISGSPGPNKHLSWANLHYNYHRWGRVMSSGIMNGFETQFSSYTKSKRQDVIKISFCCDDYLNVNSFFKTVLSDQGKLKSLIHNIFDDTIELTINHPTDATGTSPLSRQFDDSFDLSFK